MKTCYHLLFVLIYIDAVPCLFDNVLTSLCQVYSHLAQWTLELLFQPEVNAL